ncbi:MAG: arginase family protein [Draconibacterium sp.]
MDIRHYFDAVDFSKYNNTSSFSWKYSMGERIEKTTAGLSVEDIRSLDIAIIGAPFDSKAETSVNEAPDKIRKALYQLSKLNSSKKIADFGNLKAASSLKGNYQAMRDIVDYFKELNIVTVVIGGSQDLTVGASEAFRSDLYFSLTVVDAFLDIKKGKEALNSKNFLSQIFSRQPNIFQFNLIGFQSHYVAFEYLSKVKGINHHLRLGQLRENFSSAEPVFRNTDILSFDIGSVIHSEAPGTDHFSPNGLRSEEACQLAKYAGMSSRIKFFGLFGLSTENDRNDITAKLSAQIIWYFLEGFSNQVQENPEINEDFKVYQVEVKNIDNPIVFVKSLITDRWWVQVPITGNESKYFACSEKEYEIASNNEIPELWLKYIQKSDEILK